jgi:prolyl 4-hydroxylase
LQQQELVETNPEHFTLNPFGAFRVIKTLSSDTQLIKNKIQSSVDQYEKRISSYTPKVSDLTSAAKAFHNLQETYNLKTTELAEGIIEGEKFSEALSAHDLFVIGQQLVQSKLYSRSIEYLMLSLKRSATDPNQEVQASRVLEAWVEASESLGNFKTAVRIIDELIRLEPENETLKEKRQKLENGTTNSGEKTENESNILQTRTRSVCAGLFSLDAKLLSQLHCHLVSPGVHSKLSPFKLEEAYIDPYIVVFHDVISDKEITTLKEISRSRLQESEVVNDADGTNHKDTSNRISKVAWLEASVNPLIDNISTRIEDMTGLTMRTAEDLQVQQYGIGGYYIAHHDAVFVESGKTLEDGNRMSTLMFYVSPKCYSF